MSEQNTSEFTGWAIVEVMGHRKLAGYVTTKAFGSSVMFRVHAPEQQPIEHVLDKRTYLDGHGYLPAGTRVSVSREEFEQWVGVGSVYALTPCSEERAIRQLPQRIVVIELGAEPKELVAPKAEEDDEGDSYPFNENAF